MGFGVQEFLQRAMDLCFPPSEEAMLVRSLTQEDVEALFSPHTVGSVTALTQFTRPEVRALIHETKFHNNARTEELLAHLLRTYQRGTPLRANALWVPVPLSRERLRARGYNQVRVVLEKLHRDMSVLDGNAFVRVRHTRPQTELSRSERFVNVRGAFSVARPEEISGRDLILIDDVVTTGATLEAARTSLETAGPRSITLLALAH